MSEHDQSGTTGRYSRGHSGPLPEWSFQLVPQEARVRLIGGQGWWRDGLGFLQVRQFI